MVIVHRAQRRPAQAVVGLLRPSNLVKRVENIYGVKTDELQLVKV